MALREWWTLARGVNVLMGAITVLVGALIVGGVNGNEVVIPLILHTLSVALFMAGWNALNDLMDIDVDRINRPNRPLPSGKISEKQAKNFAWATMILSFFTLLAIIFHAEKNIGHMEWSDSVVIWIIALILMCAYEFDGVPFKVCLKKSGLWGNLSVSGLIAVVIVFGASAVGHGTNSLPWFVALCAMMIGTAREIIKDVEDMEGDSERNTLPMKIGAEKARVAAWVCAFFGFVSMWLPFLFNQFPRAYVVFMTPSMFLLLRSKVPIAKGDDSKASKMLKRALQFGLIGFITCGIMNVF